MTAVSADTSVLKALKKIRTPQKQRNREFWLLLFACAISGAALTLVQLGALGTIDPMILVIGGALAVLVFALHVVLRVVASDADPFVLPIATLLTGLGVARLCLSCTGVRSPSASIRRSHKRLPSPCAKASTTKNVLSPSTAASARSPAAAPRHRCAPRRRCSKRARH